MPQSNEACVPQLLSLQLRLLKPVCLEPMLHNKGSHQNEKPHTATKRSPHSQLEKSPHSNEDPPQPKYTINKSEKNNPTFQIYHTSGLTIVIVLYDTSLILTYN